jgi:hypothetical protein
MIQAQGLTAGKDSRANGSPCAEQEAQERGFGGPAKPRAGSLGLRL